jgi:hypothetical protein
LIEILYKEEYFGFKDSAIQYVESLIIEIRDNLSACPKHIAPEYFSKYGEKLLYTSFRKNKTTQWYVFFNKYQENDEIIYLVRYLSNNHMIAHLL